MKIDIKITKKGNQRSIKISKALAEKLNIQYLQYTNVRFGFKVAHLDIMMDNNLAENEIVLTSKVVSSLHLPTNCTYNIKVVDNEIILGPFIGIYMGRKETTLLKKLRVVESYVVNYPELNGVVFAFTLDQINRTDLTITGYYFNPTLGVWEKATLPYPSSIFRKNTYNTDWRDHFGSLYGDRIFNYRAIDKWEMHRRLSPFPEINEHLPHTTLYQKMDDVFDVVENYNDVYIKPISGKKGMGIYNVVFKDGNYIIKTRDSKENKEWKFDNKKECTEFLEPRLEKEEYIIQETLNIQVENRAIDFRIGVDKDQTGIWKNFMFISRVSGENSIVSNRLLSEGTIELIPDVLKNRYHMNDQEISEYEEKLRELAIHIANKLDLTGLRLGKLAFDIAIDKDKKIWVIEINSNYPDDNLKNDIDNRKLYYEIRHINMLYAKRLAGFTEMDNEYEIQFADKLEKNNESRKYVIHAGVTQGRKGLFEKVIKDLIETLPGSYDYNQTTKKFVIQLESSMENVLQFIKKIQSQDGKEYYKKSIIAIETIE